MNYISNLAVYEELNKKQLVLPNFRWGLSLAGTTVQKMKFSIKDFFSKCVQICRNLRIWSYLLKKSLMENFIFCAGTLRKSCKKSFEKSPQKYYGG